MLQALPELVLMLRWQPAELRIVLQGALLFSGRHIFVTTQPVAGVTLLLSPVLRLSWRLLLAVWLALRGLVSLSRRVVTILLGRAENGNGKHGGETCRHQSHRHMSRSFQVSRLSFPRIFNIGSINSGSIVNPVSRFAIATFLLRDNYFL